MARYEIPEMLQGLWDQEDKLRQEAVKLVAQDKRLQLHLVAIECAMNLAYVFRQFPTDDEDTKVVQVLGMRMFNAFGSSTKLGLSGYSQNSALIMRDILETVFLLDLFKDDKKKIEQWRLADKHERMRHFRPVAVRKALDARDGFTEKKRAEVYELLSELAAHPTMSSALMMRPSKGGDAVIGPFVEATTLEAVLAELGKLAIQAGETLDQFFPESWEYGFEDRVVFAEVKKKWLDEFYSAPAAAQSSPATDAK